MAPPPVFAPLAPLMVPPFPCPFAAPPVPLFGGPVMPPIMPGPMPVNPCGGCAAPVLPAPVMPMMQTTMRPVIETRMRPENVTTYEQVARTEVRREAVQVTVPVTTQKQVTVDEGRYQMVWVPKPVTKTVAETAYRQETRYRDVPIQVVQTVPRQVTRLVPEQTVRYVPETRMVQGCAPGTAQAMFLPIAPPVLGAVPLESSEQIQPLPENPERSGTVPSPYETNREPAANGASTAAPIQSSDNAEWTTIRQRTAANTGIELQSYSQPVVAIPARTQVPQSASRSLFSPVRPNASQR